MAWLIVVLKALRSLSYFVFAPSPDTKPRKLTGTDAVRVGQDTIASLGWIALVVLVARQLGFSVEDAQAKSLVEAAVVIWPILIAIISTTVRWFRGTPEPLPSPPPV